MTRANDPDPNKQAAKLLQAMLDRKLEPEDARKQWPMKPVAVDSAVTFIDYFAEGQRIPEVDAMIRSMIIMLLNAHQGTGEPEYDEELQAWRHAGQVAVPLRSAPEVAKRVLVLNVIRQRADMQAALWKDPARSADVRSQADAMLEWVSGNELQSKLEGPENDLMQLPAGRAAPNQPEQSLVMRAHWIGEAGIALAWSLGVLDTLPTPSDPGDFIRLDERLPREPSVVASFIEHAKLRSAEEIARARAQLRGLREQWQQRCQEKRTDEQTNLHNSRVLERYRALVWLTTPDEPWLWTTNTEASIPNVLDAPE